MKYIFALIVIIVLPCVTCGCGRNNNKLGTPQDSVKQTAKTSISYDDAEEESNSYNDDDWIVVYENHYDELEELIIENLRDNNTDEELIALFDIDIDNIDRKKLRELKKGGKGKPLTELRDSFLNNSRTAPLANNPTN